MDPFKHHRRSLRLKGYDYSQEGAYYVTIVTQHHLCLFGDAVNGAMRLNELGRALEDEWLKTAEIRQNIQLDYFMVMPNHFHAVVFITRNVVGRGTLQRAPTENTREQFGKPIYGSLASIVRAFKAVTTKRVNDIRGTQGAPVWQRGYYEHIVRNERELQRIRAYIVNNPANWQLDQENPIATIS